MKKVFTFNFFWVTLLLLLAGFYSSAQQIYQQLPECTSLVPYFEKDLSYSPTASFTTPEFNRQPGCCGNTDNNDDYVSFYVTLHPDVAMFELVVAPGYADPPGAGIYNIISGDMITPSSCGTDIPGGVPICITGSGPHKITYYKPGNNKIKYIFRQIPKPIYPADQGTRINCTLPLPIYGLNNINITAISSTNVDAGVTTATLNSYMSCFNCENPVFSPGVNSSYPYTITYQVTGTPKAAACGTFPTSGTFTVTVYDELTITSSNETFCAGGSGATLTGTAEGGDGNYNYFWLDAAGDTIVWTQDYTTDVEGIYTVGVSDGLSTATCPNPETTVSVSIANTPIVDAGPNKTACQSNPTVQLGGSVQYANALWVGGLGTFTPDRFTADATYTPTLTEITSVPHSVTLTLTSTDAGGGCIEQSDQVTISYSTNMDIVPTITPVVCYGQTTTISTVVNGGVPSYSYEWSTGSLNSDILVSAGTYGLNVTDSYLCQTTVYFTVNQPTPIELALSSTDETVLGNDGSVAIVVSGGDAPYTIVWTNQFGAIVGTGNSVSPLPDGIYTATVTDANGCTVSASTVINTFACSGLEVSAVATNVLCYNGTTGTVTATPSGGSGSYSYSWNTTPAASTTASVNDLPDGTYTVTLTDINTLCFDMFSVTVYQPTQLTNTMTQTNVTTEGGSNGTATASPQGGTPVYDFLWSNGQSGNNLMNHTAAGLEAGSYSVQITDDNNCAITDYVTITQPPCNDFIIAVNTINPLCAGGNGSASVYISTGTWTNITWSTGTSNVTSISGLVAGSYSVQVTSAGCTATKNFTISQPDPISIGLATSNITCAGIQPPNGSIDITVSGGTYPQYTYSWSSLGKVIAETQDIYMLPASTYTVTITDENGCTASTSIGISQPQELHTDYTYTDNLCFGQSIGTINATTTGGTLPYSFNWVNSVGGSVAATEDLNSLAFGNYYLTVTDGNNCSFGPMLAHISQPELLTATASMTAQVSCIGGSDGAAQVVANSGTTPYTYAWTGPSSFSSPNNIITNISAGLYSVTITDAHTCTTTSSVTITTVADITVPSIICPAPVGVFANASCVATGVSLGTPTTADNCSVSAVTNDAPATFPLGVTIVTWTVTDGSGNSATCTQTVTVTDNIVPTIICPSPVGAFANASCVAAGVSLGTPTTADNCSVSTVTNDAPATFPLGVTTVTWTVTDGSGNSATCTQTVTVTDNQNPVISNCPTNISLGNDSENCGAIVNWTVPTYTDNCGASMTFTNTPGQYFQVGTTTVTYTVTDGSGNVSTCTFNVTVSDTQLPVITCPAQIESCDPAISFNLPVISDNCGIQSFSQIAGLPSGTFPIGTTNNTFEATDIHGNVNTCSFNVVIYPIPVITFDVTQVSCNGFEDGEIEATISVGTAPYTYNWTNGANTEDLTDLIPGTYSLTVIDDNGCSDNSATMISQPSSLTLNAVLENVTCFNGSDASIDLTIGGGTTPYSYNWNNGVTTQDLSGLESGTYDVIVSDANGCEVVYSATITEPDSLILSSIDLDATCDSPTGTITVTLSGGTNPYSFEWSNGSTDINLYDVVSGIYTLEVVDANGCSNSITDTIGTTSSLSSELSVKDAKCYGEYSGEISVNILSGYAPFTYAWSDGQSTSVATDLASGNYSVTITDLFGCEVTLSTDVNQPDSLYIVLNNSLYSGGYNISQYGGDDGYINSTVYGGISPYDYSWFGPDNFTSVQQNITNLEPGAYLLTVSDANGCQVNISSRLVQPDILEMPNGFSPNGDQDNEYFVVHGIDAYPDNTIQVFNRWGNLIYDLDGYKNEWNGKNMNGESLPDGTYFVILTVRVNGEELDPLTGYVDLRR